MDNHCGEDAPDPLVEAVYDRAFPGIDREGTLATGRYYAIRERTGRMPEDQQPEQIKKEYLEVLKDFKFDRRMRNILADTRTGPELVLFTAHAGETYFSDFDRLDSLPPQMGPSVPTYAGTFNRASHLLAEDLKAIDEAIAALTGRPRPSSDLPPR